MRAASRNWLPPRFAMFEAWAPLLRVQEILRRRISALRRLVTERFDSARRTCDSPKV